MNIKLCLSYDGSNYHGWQRQENAVTIQQKVEEAINKIIGHKIQVTGCSRTDAGVHALQYVCNFFSDTKIPIDKIPIALNTALPFDIRIKNAEFVDDSFHARFSAKSKTYRYYIWNKSISDPFFSRYAYHFPVKLDIEKMKLAAQALVGEYDFSAFMASGGSQKTTVRQVNYLTVESENGKISIEINANAYLYNMVRIISGTLVYAGCGKLSLPDVKRLLETKKRVEAGITAPAQGLFLKEVFYE